MMLSEQEQTALKALEQQVKALFVFCETSFQELNNIKLLSPVRFACSVAS